MQKHRLLDTWSLLHIWNVSEITIVYKSITYIKVVRYVLVCHVLLTKQHWYISNSLRLLAACRQVRCTRIQVLRVRAVECWTVPVFDIWICILNSYATLGITLEIIFRISRCLDFGSESTWHSTLTKHPSRYSMVAVEVFGILMDYDVASNIYNIKVILKHLLYQGYFQTFTTSMFFWDIYNIKVYLRHLEHHGSFETFTTSRFLWDIYNINVILNHFGTFWASTE